MTEIDEQQLRLIAAKVLYPDKLWRHEYSVLGNCVKCGELDELQSPFCPIPDLPEDKLEVLAFRCRDRVVSEHLAGQYYDAITDIWREHHQQEYWVRDYHLTASEMIIAAGKAGGILGKEAE